MPQLLFEFVDNKEVYEFSTPFAALSSACSLFNRIVVEERRSYQEYRYEMLSYLRFLPMTLRDKPLAKRSEEESLRNRVLHILWYREDLVRHFFRGGVMTADVANKIVNMFEQNTVVPNMIASNPKSLKNRSEKVKASLADLINKLPVKNGFGLLYPHITDSELESLLMTGQSEIWYTCRNQAQLAFILHTLAHLDVIDKTDYYKTVCRHGRLLRMPKTFPDGTIIQNEVTSKDLSSAYDQIHNLNNVTYTTIRECILSIIE